MEGFYDSIAVLNHKIPLHKFYNYLCTDTAR